MERSRLMTCGILIQPLSRYYKVQFDTTTTGQPSRTKLIRRVLLLILLGLGLLTAWLIYQQQTPYQVQVFKTAGGWGYDIVTDGKPVIHQPTIPGQPGLVGFASEAQARRVGERVVERLQQEKALPALTNDELRRLGVKIP